MPRKRNPLAVEIGERMRFAREALGLSQAQVGMKLEELEETYRSWELGNSMVPMRILTKLPKVLQKPVGYFLGFPGDAHISNEDRVVLVSFQQTHDPELRKASRQTVETNFRLDQRTRPEAN